MYYRRMLNVLLPIMIVIGGQFVSVDSYAQKNKRPPKTSKNKPPKNPKDAARLEEKKDKQLDKDIKQLKKEYKKSLDKNVTKRMKRNKKRSTRYANNQKDPFYTRWFSRRSKRVKKSKE